jgi:hypothetical protein
MAGWRASLKKSRHLFETEYSAHLDLADWEIKAMLGHFKALESYIPWELLDIPHYHVQGRVPDSVLKQHQQLIYHPGPESGKLRQEPYYTRDLVAVISQIINGIPREHRYYARIRDGEFDVHLPQGEFEFAVYPRNLPWSFNEKQSWRLRVLPPKRKNRFRPQTEGSPQDRLGRSQDREGRLKHPGIFRRYDLHLAYGRFKNGYGRIKNRLKRLIRHQ